VKPVDEEEDALNLVAKIKAFHKERVHPLYKKFYVKQCLDMRKGKYSGSSSLSTMLRTIDREEFNVELVGAVIERIKTEFYPSIDDVSRQITKDAVVWKRVNLPVFRIQQLNESYWNQYLEEEFEKICEDGIYDRVPSYKIENICRIFSGKSVHNVRVRVYHKYLWCEEQNGLGKRLENLINKNVPLGILKETLSLGNPTMELCQRAILCKWNIFVIRLILGAYKDKIGVMQWYTNRLYGEIWKPGFDLAWEKRCVREMNQVNIGGFKAMAIINEWEMCGNRNKVVAKYYWANHVSLVQGKISIEPDFSWWNTRYRGGRNIECVLYSVGTVEVEAKNKHGTTIFTFHTTPAIASLLENQLRPGTLSDPEYEKQAIAFIHSSGILSGNIPPNPYFTYTPPTPSSPNETTSFSRLCSDEMIIEAKIVSLMKRKKKILTEELAKLFPKECIKRLMEREYLKYSREKWIQYVAD